MENNLAENIHAYRKEMGLTQEQLAERLGVTLGAVSKWERGSSEPDLAYIMDLAELFHVSVDALIGYSMRGAGADEEADRIEAMYSEDPAREGEKAPTAEAIAAEYDRALKKFPNHFRIVCGAAFAYQQIGVLRKKDSALKKALELFRHAIDLLPQNKEPRINEALLREEIAGCWSALKNYGKAIEEYKKNNLTGGSDARIGCLYILYENKPEKGIGYTERAFFSHICDMVTTMSGYVTYYLSTARYDAGIRAAGWTIGFMESLKEETEKHTYFDKIASLFYLARASLQEGAGLREASEESLREAVRRAAAFDGDPVFTMENTVFLKDARKKGIYDETGATAIDGLKNLLEDYRAFISDAFREKCVREIENAERHGTAGNGSP